MMMDWQRVRMALLTASLDDCPVSCTDSVGPGNDKFCPYHEGFADGIDELLAVIEGRSDLGPGEIAP